MEAEDHVVVEEPFEISLSASAAARWGDVSLDGLKPVEPDGLAAELEAGPATSRGRLDVLTRRSGRWSLWQTLLFDGRVPALPEEQARVGLLVRVPGEGEGYGWAEFVGRVSSRPLKLRWLKNVSLPPRGKAAVAALYVDGEDGSRLPDVLKDRRVFRFVPHRVALVCETDGERGRCGVVAEGSSRSSSSAQGQFRVFRLGGEPTAIRITSPGISVIRPTGMGLESLRAGPFLALSLKGDREWASVVAEVVLDDACLVRLEGGAAPAPPGFTPVPSPIRCGLLVRPRLLPDLQAVREKEARLVVLPEGRGSLSEIALSVASGDDDGIFDVRLLPAGRYRLKLISSMAAAAVVPATLETGVVEDVRFPPGPMVRGRLLPSGQTDPALPASVQVIKQAPPLEARPPREGDGAGADRVDSIRGVTPDKDGTFSFAVPETGTYELWAFWGKARGRRTFKAQEAAPTLNLGDIPLQVGGVLRGKADGCEPPGEVRVTPLPDFSKPPGSVPFEFLRFPIAPDGRFVADGLPSGALLISASCHGAFREVVPGSVVMPDEGDVVVDLVASTSSKAATP
ncbi:MAG: hypothetical protein ABI584_09780 [Acidobacteriota bacterium]